jgi:GT2 family glycosyltransferase
MIPVLGIAYISRPDLLRRLLASIDTEVGRIVIIDNSPDVSWASASLPEDCYVIRAHHNLGVASSWNLIIKANPLADYWVIANSDVTFGRGDLDRLDAHMQTVGGWALMPDPIIFGIDPHVIELAGWFDENIAPAYFEDNDFARRCALAGVQVNHLPFGGLHEGSATINSDVRYRNANNRTFPQNQRYYISKWGGGPGQEVYSTPFNQGGDIRATQPSIERLRALTWR